MRQSASQVLGVLAMHARECSSGCSSSPSKSESSTPNEARKCVHSDRSSVSGVSASGESDESADSLHAVFSGCRALLSPLLQKVFALALGGGEGAHRLPLQVGVIAHRSTQTQVSLSSDWDIELGALLAIQHIFILVPVHFILTAYSLLFQCVNLSCLFHLP